MIVADDIPIGAIRERYLLAQDCVEAQASTFANAVVRAVRCGLELPPYALAEMNAYLDARERRESAVAELVAARRGRK